MVSQVESALERVLSPSIMRGGVKPRIRTLHAGENLTRQGESGADVYLVLTGYFGSSWTGAGWVSWGRAR